MFSFVQCIIFFLFGCSNSKSNTSNLNEFAIHENFQSININWSFGAIRFSDSNEYKFEFTKKTDKVTFYIDNSTLFITYDGKDVNDLNIYLDKSKNYDSLILNCTYTNISVDNMNIKDTTFNSKTGSFLIEDCKIQNFASKIFCHNDIEKSKIHNSTINHCNIIYNRIHELYLTECTFNEVFLNLDYAYAVCRSNSFSKILINQKSGTTYMQLNGNYGYTFEINSIDFSLDMETIQYKNLYFYKNGERKINLNGTASFDIRRYFA